MGTSAPPVVRGITMCHSTLCPLQKASSEGGLPMNLAEDLVTRAPGEQGAWVEVPARGDLSEAVRPL